MKAEHILYLGLALILSAPLQAAPDIQYWRTDNGARVMFVATDALPMVDVRVVFDAGSSRDGDQPGLSKLTNSMLDQGADGISADRIAETLGELGANMGNSSLRDMAWVELRSLSQPAQLSPALSLLRQVLAKPDFPDQALERLRGHVLAALKRKKESPSKLAKQMLYRELYGEHPYAHDPLGDEASVKAITREDLINHHRRLYTADNAIVVMVGDLGRRQAQRIANELVMDLPSAEVPPALPPVLPITEASLQALEFPSTQTTLLMAQPGMSRLDPDFYPLYLANHILGGSGLVSRLSEEIREQRGLSYSAYSYFLPMRAPGPFVVGMQTRAEKADTALKIARQTLARYVDTGPSEEELKAAKQNITGGFALRVDSNEEISEYLAMIAFYRLPMDYLVRFNERVEEVSLEDVRTTLKRRINPRRMLTVRVGPAPLLANNQQPKDSP